MKCVSKLCLIKYLSVIFVLNPDSDKCLEDFTYGDESFSKMLKDGMQKVSFNAVSGPFIFGDNGERTTGIEIWQYNNKSAGLSRVPSAKGGSCHLQHYL